MANFVVVKDGKEKFQLPGKILPDGTIRLKNGPSWQPVVNAAACKERGLDPVKVLKAESPVDVLAHVGDNGHGLHVYAVEEWNAIQRRRREEADAALETAVPGVAEAIWLDRAAHNEMDRYEHEFNRMMEDEMNDGARPPRPEDRSIAEKLKQHLSDHPRAALYLRAKNQAESAHWADNTGKGGAGLKAMEILAAGGGLEEAATAIAVRREWVD